MAESTLSPSRGMFSWRDDLSTLDMRMRAYEDRIKTIEGEYLKVGDFRTLEKAVETLAARIDSVADNADGHSTRLGEMASLGPQGPHAGMRADDNNEVSTAGAHPSMPEPPAPAADYFTISTPDDTKRAQVTTETLV